MEIEFSKRANEELNEWLFEDKKVYNKIVSLLDDIVINQFKGIGHPEPLKGNLSGYWSRRINYEHRLVYKIEKETIYVLQCRFHYKS